MYVTRARSPASARLKIDIDTPPDPGRTAVQAAADFYNVFTQRVDSQVFAIGRDSETPRQPEKCPTRRNPPPKVGISPSVQEPCYPHSPSLSVSSSLPEAKTSANPGLSERQRSSRARLERVEALRSPSLDKDLGAGMSARWRSLPRLYMPSRESPPSKDVVGRADHASDRTPGTSQQARFGGWRLYGSQDRFASESTPVLNRDSLDTDTESDLDGETNEYSLWVSMGWPTRNRSGTFRGNSPT